MSGNSKNKSRTHVDDGKAGQMVASHIFRIFLPFALGYFLASIFRAINAVIAPDLVRELGLSASELGFAVSAFFLCATMIQIPYGILLDRYDPRRLYAIFLLLTAFGAVMIAFSQGIVLLSIGRAFIALGTAASAVTSYKVFSMWFPAERLAMVNGLAVSAGGLGMMAGTLPVEAAMQFLNWREVHLIAGALVIAGAAAVVMVAPTKKTVSSGITLMQQISGLHGIVNSLAFWRSAPLLFTVTGGYGSFSAIWAGPWVRDVAGLNDFETANLMMILIGSMTVSAALTGFVAKLARRVGLSSLGVAVMTAIAFTFAVTILFLQANPSHSSVIVIWGVIGLIAPLNLIIYAALSGEFPLELTGRLNACLTLSWFLGSFFFQNVYGWALDQFPSNNGSYALEGHRLGIGIMITAVIIALVWYFVATMIMSKRNVEAYVR